MSLFSSIRLAANTLQANQIGLQVVGQNIANANTPGYIREEAVLVPAPAQRVGALLLGTGVQVEAIVQKVDKYLEQRLRSSISDRAGAEVQANAFTQLETIIGELGDNDLSTLMSNFFSSVAEVLNEPESVAVRNLAIQQGAALTDEVNRLAEGVDRLRSTMNDQAIAMAGDVNRLVNRVCELNVQITMAECGETSASDAVGLRDQQMQALEDLAGLIDIDVREQPDGSVAVYCGGDYLVFQGVAREVEVLIDGDRGMGVADVCLVGTDAPLDSAGGQLGGLLAARDDVLGGFADRLDDFARTLAFEFNRIYASGQGLTGYQTLTGEYAVAADDRPLNQAGLDFTPVNGSFQIMVVDTTTGAAKTTGVAVDLNGPGQDTTLADLAAAISAVDGVSASITIDGRLTIACDSSGQEFAFANDTSGVLAALGLNTFFTGNDANSLAVSQTLRADPGKFAASRGGIGADTENAVELAAFIDRPIESQGGFSLATLYDTLIGDTTQASSTVQALAEGALVFENTLRGQKLAVSGVNLDEEAVRMIGLQRSFQAAARYIATLSDLLETLTSL